MSTGKIVKTDEEWKKILTPEQFRVTRMKATELACSGAYWDNHEPGIYKCVCCDNELFTSNTKFESGTGWPSFWEPVAQENIRKEIDTRVSGWSERKCFAADVTLTWVTYSKTGHPLPVSDIASTRQR